MAFFQRFPLRPVRGRRRLAVAYLIRFNGEVPVDFWSGALHTLVWVLPAYGVMFRIFGLYRGMWVFASLPDLMRIAKAVRPARFVADGRCR